MRANRRWACVIMSAVLLAAAIGCDMGSGITSLGTSGGGGGGGAGTLDPAVVGTWLNLNGSTETVWTFSGDSTAAESIAAPNDTTSASGTWTADGGTLNVILSFPTPQLGELQLHGHRRHTDPERAGLPPDSVAAGWESGLEGAIALRQP